jgi:hypothetical protein
MDKFFVIIKKSLLLIRFKNKLKVKVLLITKFEKLHS